jgi:pimeloyl-ACP methyl ester carboxylesterase
MPSHRSLHCLALLLSAPLIATPAPAQTAQPADASRVQTPQTIDSARWQSYGTTPVFALDATAPGGGSMRAAPLVTPSEPRSSAAVMPLPQAFKAGERITAIFWARSDHPESVPVTIQTRPPSMAGFAAERIALTPRWQRHAISGVAATDLAGGSQFLVVQLGHVRSAVSFGPVAFLPGKPDSAAVRRAFAGFRPIQLAQDVRFASDRDVTLAGTLRLPLRTGTTPYPAVILLNGNGPWPRGIFPRLADRLTAAGIATLDYDKRGIGKSTGVFLDTMEVIGRDASAAVAYLRGRPEIDGTRIAVLGNSQGGVIAPAVAANDPAIAAVVMLAGPAGEQGRMFLDGMRRSLVSGGTRADAIEPILAATALYLDAQAAAAPPKTTRPLEQALSDAFLAGGWPRDKAAGFIAILSSPTVISQYRAAPNEALRRIQAPVLALYAGEDDVVLTELSLPQAKAALSHNPDATVIVMQGTNHVFQPRGTDAAGKPVFAGPHLSDPGTLDLVGHWLESRLRSKIP